MGNAPTSEQEFESLLEYLKRNRGFDFTGYKRGSLARRVQKRMQAAGIERFPEYVDYLEVHPEEFAALFNVILINVTSFFRDESTWAYLAEAVLPQLHASRGPNAPLRVWSAGCASGEEAYTLAMVFAEHMGADAFQERVKIYATDVDEQALATGRHAAYTDRDVADIPPALLRKYFETQNHQYVFRKDLRRQVIFGRHDLITDAPISRVDLLVCRNTLMYLNSETQSRILARFHFALNDGGILFLGRAETLLTHASIFQSVDLKRRISTKVPRGNLDLRDRLLLLAQNGTNEEPAAVAHQYRLREIALDSGPVAVIIVDGGGMLTYANERARALFGVGRPDIGRALQDLKMSYRPVELRSHMDQVTAERRPVRLRDVEWQTPGAEVRWMDLLLTPILDAGTQLGISIAFIDVTESRRLQRQLEQARQELEAAYEELQSTNEELETTNEELQSTVEELETTNEELQSTNEELETMNEELQSTNEELQTINDELRLRGDELTNVNEFLESILTSVRGAVVVVDQELRILAWNRTAQQLWGLTEDDVLGTHFLNLDIGLPLAELKQPLRAVLSGSHEQSELDVPATNRRGKAMRCRIVITRLTGGNSSLRGVILMMEQTLVEPKVAEPVS